jgi:hypothetical protein
MEAPALYHSLGSREAAVMPGTKPLLQRGEKSQLS